MNIFSKTTTSSSFAFYYTAAAAATYYLTVYTNTCGVYYVVRGMSTTSNKKAAAASASESASSSSASSYNKIIDSHLHVWANEIESKQYKYEEEYGQTQPLDSLRNNSNVLSLLKKMKESGVDGSLIVQPINYMYDHSYVLEEALKKYPNKFKGMLLHDPTLSCEDAINRLDELALKGFVGVRYNPYLWPPPLLIDENNIDGNKDDGIITTTTNLKRKKKNNNNNNNNNILMSTPNGSGLAVYKRCGELNMPVGIMCFKGLDIHINDIISLLESSTKTIMILDHFAFTKLGNNNNNNNNNIDDDDHNNNNEIVFQQLLQLGRDYPEQLIIKISALFRLGDTDGYPYKRIQKERFIPLLDVFGPNRLMYGSDFPFVLLEQNGECGGECGYKETIDLISNVWLKDYPESIKKSIMGGTAERIFGQWGG
jgi:predicted TIM-barrel fold metal-dependent hydrolase